MADKELEQDDPIKAAAQEADEAPAQEEGGQGEVPAELGIEALKIQLENERKARFDAEQRAQAASNFAHQSNAEVQDSNLQLVVTAIETVKRDNLMNRRAYAEAMASQDFDRAAEIQDAMSMNNAKLLQLENGKNALEARAAEARQPRQQQQQHQDPVEAVASQLSPRSASWIRAHPECVKNQKTYTKMIGLHNVAIADGIAPDTDEYFDYIETNLGYKKPPKPQDVEQDADPQSTAAKPVTRKAPLPAAPPSRGSSNGSRITLSAAQREAASISGLTEEEYARNLVAENKRRAN